MPRPSRARRILKWTGVGVSLLMSVAWCASYRTTPIRAMSTNYAITIANGAVFGLIAYPNARQEALFLPDWLSRVYAEVLFVRPSFDYQKLTSQESSCTIILPFWLLLLVTAIPTAWLWHRDRRRIRPGCCSRCGYDLTGNTSGVCSECGAKNRSIKLIG